LSWPMVKQQTWGMQRVLILGIECSLKIEELSCNMKEINNPGTTKLTRSTNQGPKDFDWCWSMLVHRILGI
jgi:hypothetical protein